MNLGGTFRLGLVCAIIAASTSAALGQPEQASTNAAPVPSMSANQIPPDVEKALQMPKGAEQSKALGIAAVAWAKTDPTGALAWLLKLPQDVAGPLLFPVTSTCGQTNGKLCADWLVQQGTLAALSRLHALLWAWATGDPVPAAAWCAQAPKNVRYLAFFSVGDGWGGRKDAPAGADWAGKLPDHDDRLAAVRGVAQSWSLKDLTATTVWIKGLAPEEMKTGAESVVGTKRAFSKGNKDIAGDEASLRAWLDQLPLSAADKDEVLKSAPINIYATLRAVTPAAK
jgi:hypothetical protein